MCQWKPISNRSFLPFFPDVSATSSTPLTESFHRPIWPPAKVHGARCRTICQASDADRQHLKEALSSDVRLLSAADRQFYHSWPAKGGSRGMFGPGMLEQEMRCFNTMTSALEWIPTTSGMAPTMQWGPEHPLEVGYLSVLSGLVQAEAIMSNTKWFWWQQVRSFASTWKTTSSQTGHRFKSGNVCIETRTKMWMPKLWIRRRASSLWSGSSIRSFIWTSKMANQICGNPCRSGLKDQTRSLELEMTTSRAWNL